MKSRDVFNKAGVLFQGSVLYCTVLRLTFRYGFHYVQEAHEQAACLRLVQLVTARAVANQGLGAGKLRDRQSTAEQTFSADQAGVMQLCFSSSCS